MKSRKQHAIEIDRQYHTDYFSRYQLGDRDSWMGEPEDFVLSHLNALAPNSVVLDLGSGPGRLSIPILQRLDPNSGCLVCIDQIDEAINGLRLNIDKNFTASRATIIQSDIANIRLVPRSFDAIVAWSVWEATFDPAELSVQLCRVEAATRPGGFVLIMFNTAIESRDRETGAVVENFKLGNMSTADCLSLLERAFGNWTDCDIRLVDDSETTFEGGAVVAWKSVHVMFFARKPKER